MAESTEVMDVVRATQRITTKESFVLSDIFLGKGIGEVAEKYEVTPSDVADLMKKYEGSGELENIKFELQEKGKIQSIETGIAMQAIQLSDTQISTTNKINNKLEVSYETLINDIDREIHEAIEENDTSKLNLLKTNRKNLLLEWNKNALVTCKYAADIATSFRKDKKDRSHQIVYVENEKDTYGLDKKEVDKITWDG